MQFEKMNFFDLPALKITFFPHFSAVFFDLFVYPPSISGLIDSTSFSDHMEQLYNMIFCFGISFALFGASKISKIRKIEIFSVRGYEKHQFFKLHHLARYMRHTKTAVMVARLGVLKVFFTARGRQIIFP